MVVEVDMVVDKPRMHHRPMGVDRPRRLNLRRDLAVPSHSHDGTAFDGDGSACKHAPLAVHRHDVPVPYEQTRGQWLGL